MVLGRGSFGFYFHQAAPCNFGGALFVSSHGTTSPIQRVARVCFCEYRLYNCPFCFSVFLDKRSLGELAIAPVNWATPTIGGLLSYHQISEYGRYLIFLLLPLPFLLLRYQTTISMEFSVALLTVITVPITFFGWSFDQTILLIPIALIFSWVFALNNKVFYFWFTLMILIAVAVNYWQRLLNTNDVYYFWVPLFWCLIFGLSWYLQSIKSETHDKIAL